MFGAFSTDTLIQMQIWAHSANTPASCLWIDTPHAYGWTSWNFHFLMGGSNFQLKIHPGDGKNFCKFFSYSISYLWKATKSGSAQIFWLFQLVSPQPRVHRLHWQVQYAFSNKSNLADSPYTRWVVYKLSNMCADCRWLSCIMQWAVCSHPVSDRVVLWLSVTEWQKPLHHIHPVCQATLKLCHLKSGLKEASTMGKDRLW